jgi:RimJ/RimL family protein N-acetyltransferase
MDSSHLPKILKAQAVQGRSLIFRDVKESDAEYILKLRTDSQKSRYLSVTEPSLEKQKAWLKRYADQTDQVYFIIETLLGEPLGTVRLYDAQEYSFSWGSWILQEGAPRTAAIESALMVYAYAIDYLKFQSSHFEVRKGNESVWRFHERFGAMRIGETTMDYLYHIEYEQIVEAQKRYKKYLALSVNIK